MSSVTKGGAGTSWVRMYHIFFPREKELEGNEGGGKKREKERKVDLDSHASPNPACRCRLLISPLFSLKQQPRRRNSPSAASATRKQGSCPLNGQKSLTNDSMQLHGVSPSQASIAAAPPLQSLPHCHHSFAPSCLPIASTLIAAARPSSRCPPPQPAADSPNPEHSLPQSLSL